MRNIFLQNGSIFYINDDKEISINGFAPISISDIKYKSVVAYSNVIHEILLLGGDDSSIDRYIIHSELFSIPGFIQTLQKHHSFFCSDIDASICHLNFISGNYFFIDIGVTGSIFSIAVENKQSSIIEKKKIDCKPLFKSIYNTFKPHLNLGIDSDELIKTLFNYSRIAEINDFITNPEFGINCNSELFDDYNLHFDGSGFTNIFKKSVTLSTFIDVIYQCLQDFINQNCIIGRSIIIKSPLTAYIPINKLLNTGEINAVSEFELLSSSAISSNYFPEILFSNWILSETNNLSFNFPPIYKRLLKPLGIEINDLKKDLEPTFFSIKNLQLVKYYTEIEKDCCNNLHLKIQTLDQKEFYQLIN